MPSAFPIKFSPVIRSSSRKEKCFKFCSRNHPVSMSMRDAKQYRKVGEIG